MCYLNASYCCTHHFDSHYQPASFVWDGASVSTEEDEKHLLNLLEKKKQSLAALLIFLAQGTAMPNVTFSNLVVSSKSIK